MNKTETKKKRRPLLYFYNKKKFESRIFEREELKKTIPRVLLDFLKDKPYHFTVYSQKRHKP